MTLSIEILGKKVATVEICNDEQSKQIALSWLALMEYFNCNDFLIYKSVFSKNIDNCTQDL